MAFPQLLDKYLPNSPLWRAEASVFQSFSRMLFHKVKKTPAQTSRHRPELQSLQWRKLSQTSHMQKKRPRLWISSPLLSPVLRTFSITMYKFFSKLWLLEFTTVVQWKLSGPFIISLGVYYSIGANTCNSYQYSVSGVFTQRSIIPPSD